MRADQYSRSVRQPTPDALRLSIICNSLAGRDRSASEREHKQRGRPPKWPVKANPRNPRCSGISQNFIVSRSAVQICEMREAPIYATLRKFRAMRHCIESWLDSLWHTSPTTPALIGPHITGPKLFGSPAAPRTAKVARASHISSVLAWPPS